jgi:hypothetical protein
MATTLPESEPMNAHSLPDYPRGITFEQVWASLMEGRGEMEKLRKSQEKTGRQIEETAQLVEKNARRIEETNQQMKETDRRKKKYDIEWKKTMRRIDELGKQMGYLHNTFGELAEHLVAPGIAARFNELGFHFDSISSGGLKILDENGKVKTEVDLVLENGEYIIALEVKSKPKEKDVEHHIRRLEILREHRQKKHDTRIILGAIAGAVFGPAEKKAVIEAGLYVLEQSGDTMKLDIPGDFIPRKW